MNLRTWDVVALKKVQFCDKTAHFLVQGWLGMFFLVAVDCKTTATGVAKTGMNKKKVQYPFGILYW